MNRSGNSRASTNCCGLPSHICAPEGGFGPNNLVTFCSRFPNLDHWTQVQFGTGGTVTGIPRAVQITVNPGGGNGLVADEANYNPLEGAWCFCWTGEVISGATLFVGQGIDFSTGTGIFIAFLGGSIFLVWSNGASTTIPLGAVSGKHSYKVCKTRNGQIDVFVDGVKVLTTMVDANFPNVPTAPMIRVVSGGGAGTVVIDKYCTQFSP